MAEKKSDEVQVIGGDFSNEELSNIQDFNQALELLAEKLGADNVHRASDVLGDGFKLLSNKDLLAGVGCIFVTWDFHQGTHGEFVAAKVITQDNQKYVVIDGSTGIRDQLRAYTTEYNKRGGLVCEKGLRRSDYKFTDDKGELKDASTFYLDLSAS